MSSLVPVTYIYIYVHTYPIALQEQSTLPIIDLIELVYNYSIQLTLLIQISKQVECLFKHMYLFITKATYVVYHFSGN